MQRKGGGVPGLQIYRQTNGQNNKWTKDKKGTNIFTEKQMDKRIE